jgi:hypothetical protein
MLIGSGGERCSFEKHQPSGWRTGDETIVGSRLHALGLHVLDAVDEGLQLAAAAGVTELA